MTTRTLSVSGGGVRRLIGFRRPWRLILWTIALLVGLGAASTVAHLEVPPPTGVHAVGRDRTVLVDARRPELHTADPNDLRSVPLQIWHPAKTGTGHPAAYVEDLDGIASGLTDSGSLGSIEVTALRMVRTAAYEGAVVSPGRHPVIILSPGNQTNVAFYGSLAEELASHGYLVIGIDHPFQVAATAIGDGRVAVYDTAMDSEPPGSSMPAKIDERVADVMFVLDSLRSDRPELARYVASADLSRMGVMGHSVGGLTAFEVCRIEPSIAACLNMDGQGAGGPFGNDSEATPPPHPSLYLTKENLIHPVIAERFEAADAPAVRAVIPDASHDSFTDGPLFEPGFNPLTTSAQRVMTSVRSVTVAFLDQWLGEGRERPYDGLAAPADIYINVYPLGGNEPIPAG